MNNINVRGLADLQKFLDQLPAKLETNVMRGALMAGLKPIEQDAKTGKLVTVLQRSRGN